MASWQPGGGGGGGDGYWTSLDGIDLFNVNSGNVGIGTYTPDGYAKLDVSSTTKGILIPRLTQAQQNLLVGGPNGLLIYNTSQNRINVYDGYGWGSLISEPQHDELDDLVHNLAETSYEEYVYSGSKVTAVIVWTSPSKTLKIRDSQFSYAGSKVSQEINIQYNSIGVEVQRLTIVYNYSGNTIISSETTEVGS